MDDRPIGIFDSGLGGLTAVRALASAAPWESFVYLGDTAHAPYGATGPGSRYRPCPGGTCSFCGTGG